MYSKAILVAIFSFFFSTIALAEESNTECPPEIKSQFNAELNRIRNSDTAKKFTELESEKKKVAWQPWDNWGKYEKCCEIKGQDNCDKKLACQDEYSMYKQSESHNDNVTKELALLTDEFMKDMSQIWAKFPSCKP